MNYVFVCSYDNLIKSCSLMWGVSLWEKIFVGNERKDLSELSKIRNAVWERDVVSKGE